MSNIHDIIVSLLKPSLNNLRILALLGILLRHAIDPSSSYADTMNHDGANRATSYFLNNYMSNLCNSHKFHRYFLSDIFFIRCHYLTPFSFIIRKHPTERREYW